MRSFILLSILLSASLLVISGESLQAEILRKKTIYNGDTQVTLKMPEDITMGFWYTCDFYDKNSKIIASVRHVLRKRVTSTTVEVTDPDSIYFALCAERDY